MTLRWAWRLFWLFLLLLALLVLSTRVQGANGWLQSGPTCGYTIQYYTEAV
jgi:cell division protein FtsW (lipid II flippase)